MCAKAQTCFEEALETVSRAMDKDASTLDHINAALPVMKAKLRIAMDTEIDRVHKDTPPFPENAREALHELSDTHAQAALEKAFAEAATAMYRRIMAQSVQPAIDVFVARALTTAESDTSKRDHCERVVPDIMQHVKGMSDEAVAHAYTSLGSHDPPVTLVAKLGTEAMEDARVLFYAQVEVEVLDSV